MPCRACLVWRRGYAKYKSGALGDLAAQTMESVQREQQRVQQQRANAAAGVSMSSTSAGTAQPMAQPMIVQAVPMAEHA